MSKKKTTKLQSKHDFLVSSQNFVPLIFFVIIALTLGIGLILRSQQVDMAKTQTLSPVAEATPSTFISLPAPAERSAVSIESVLKNRRTRRSFQNKSLELKQVSQLLWATQGVTANWGGRTAPTAKSAYPLTVYLLVSEVNGLTPGQYLYHPGDRLPQHQLSPILTGNLISNLYQSLSISSLKNPPVVVIITGNFQKMTDAYGGNPRDENVYLEAGHAAQNLALQAESLKLGLVTLTDLDESKLRDILALPKSEQVIYTIPLGYPID